MEGWKSIMRTEGGVRGLYTGVGPTFLGYSMQGACKYGFYEYFKVGDIPKGCVARHARADAFKCHRKRTRTWLGRRTPLATRTQSTWPAPPALSFLLTLRSFLYYI